MWRCCCCCCCLVVVTIEKPSQHRSTIQACPKKGKQARADRAGIEPGTFRRKPWSRQKSKEIEFARACAIETRFNIKPKQASAVNTTRNARGQKSTPHFLRACAAETHFNIKQKHESAAHTTRNARGQKSTPHFVQACAVETHFDIKQEHESAVHTTQNARGQKSTPHFVRACAVETHFDIKQEHESLADRSRHLTLCEPAQSKRTPTSSKSTNLRYIPRKTLADRAGTSIWHQGLCSYRKTP